MEMMVAATIENELKCLPQSVKPRVILLDPEFWERFIWEINTADCLSNSEVRYGYMAACDVAERNGLPDINEIQCPNMRIIFRRNPLIQRIRIIYEPIKPKRRVR